LCKVTSSSWLEYIYIFSGFNFTAAQVVCTTALINHAFITDFIERKEKKKENRERKKWSREILAARSALFTQPFFPRGLFTVSLDGLSGRGTTCSLNIYAYKEI